MKKFINSLLLGAALFGTSSLAVQAEEVFYERENNNTIQEAQSVKIGDTVVGKSDYYDDDFYQISLEKAGDLKLSLPMHSVAGWTLSVYDAKGNKIGDEKTTRSGETAIGNSTYSIGLNKGTYYIKLEGTVSGIEALKDLEYKLSFKFDNLNKYEQEDNDSLAKATLVNSNDIIIGRSGPYDNDYYKVELKSGRNFNLSLENHPDAAWVLDLYDNNGDVIGESMYTSTKRLGNIDKSIFLSAGTYYIKVSGNLGNSKNAGETDYKLTIGDPSLIDAIFDDVKVSHNYYYEIKAITELKIIQGYADGTFKPTKSITRQQVAAMISRANLDLPVIREPYKFSDVKLSSSYYNQIQMLYQAGIVDSSNGKFKPSGTLTRAQLAKILVNTFDLKLVGKAPTFKDVKPDAWYAEYVQILASHGITTGNNGKFNPNEPVSRQHFAVFLNRGLTKNNQ